MSANVIENVGTLIYESENSSVFRREATDNGGYEIVKVLNSTHPSAEKVAQFNNEYEFTSGVKISGIRKATKKERISNRHALVLEWVDGKTLRKTMEESRPDMEEILRIAIDAAGILAEVHQHHIIHKDINADNILIEPNGDVRIIDFGISSRVNLKASHLENPNRLEGTLTFISPEQTGRMNRIVDYRSDLYSFGVVLYFLLSGKLPYDSVDPLELIHCHIARKADSLHEVDSKIPRALSDIVDKLMSKNAEDRYQSATGLQADLQTCRKQLERTGVIDDFALGQEDHSGIFSIPEKLYGREKELARLMRAFLRVSSGRTEMLLVAGYSGTGKSSLVHEVHKPITEKRGYFVTGKFDQFQRNIPYYAVIRAFSDFIDLLLTEDEETLNRWRETFNEALAPNGKVLTDVIPNLELIIGEQPEVPELNAMDAQNRFNHVFGQFVGAIATREHPLVLFIDDLQWADSPSLSLIQSLNTDTGNQAMLFIGAYRDNEVDKDHPLLRVVEQVDETATRVTRIELENLTEQNVNDIVADTINVEASEVKQLAKNVYDKTHGNSFFTIEFLKSLHHEGLISFDLESRTWKWDIDSISKASFSNNVVELMSGKIEKLEESTTEILKLAACIGNQFDLATLALISEQSKPDALKSLWPAVEEGLLIPLDNEYRFVELADEIPDLPEADFKFSHDRVQQAAYSLIAEQKKAETHLRIGRLMLNDPEIDDEDMFDIINHFDVGMELVTDPSERDELAKLNLKAADKAMASVAFIPAEKYCATAKMLINEDWVNKYDEALKSYIMLGHVKYVLGDFESAGELLFEALKQAKTNLEKVNVYFRIVELYMAQLDYPTAVKHGRDALKLLGIEWKDEEGQQTLGQYMGEIQGMMEGKMPHDFLDMPMMTDPEKIAAVTMLAVMAPSLYILAQLEAWALVIVIVVNLSMKYGMTKDTPFAFANYSQLLNMHQQYAASYAFVETAAEMIDRGGPTFQDEKVKTLFMKSEYVMSYVKPMRETEAVSQESFQAGLDCGNNLFLCWIDLHRSFTRFYQGSPLPELLEKQEVAIKRNTRIGMVQAVNVIRGIYILIQYLLENESPGEGEHEAGLAYMEEVTGANDLFSMMQYPLFYCSVLNMIGQPEKAEAQIAPFVQNQSGAGNPVIESAKNFYQSLTLLRVWKDADDAKKKEIEETVAQNQELLGVWVQNCPENYEGKFLLLQALQAQNNGKDLEAIELFDKAIDKLQESLFIQEAAMANELAARFYLSKNMKKAAGAYIREAAYLYGNWGGWKVVNYLRETYPDFMKSTGSTRTATINPLKTVTTTMTVSTTTGGISQQLDMTSILKASQAISSEIKLESLLTKMIGILMEGAGAERGFLLMTKDDSFVVQAESKMGDDEVKVMVGQPVSENEWVADSIVAYVSRTKEDVVLDDASQMGRFISDPVIMKNKTKSVICLPIIHHGEIFGMLYLTNDLSPAAFTPDRVELLKLLSGQAAVSIENSLVYEELEDRIEAATMNIRRQKEEIEDQKTQIEAEKGKSDKLLLNILPEDVAEELKAKGRARARRHEDVTVLMTDFVGFTKISEQMTPEELVDELDGYFREFDEIVGKYGLEKIKTIGDAYMAVSGVPRHNEDGAAKAVQAALDMLAFVEKRKEEKLAEGKPVFEIRIGLHTGPVVAGVVGTKKFAFDVWGDTVNTASRMESSGENGKLNVSGATYEFVKDKFNCEYRGKVHAKNKGEVDMYFVEPKS